MNMSEFIMLMMFVFGWSAPGLRSRMMRVAMRPPSLSISSMSL